MNDAVRDVPIPPDNEVLTAEEVASWLGLHLVYVRSAARSGRIPARRVGKEWRFLRDAVGAARGLPGSEDLAAVGWPASARTPDPPLVLGATEAADFLRVDLQTTYHEMASGRVPAWKEGREWRTSLGALREYLAHDPEADLRYRRLSRDTG